MTLTAEESSNKEWMESMSVEDLIQLIRLAMDQGCIRPCHVYDAVDEALDRLAKFHERESQRRKSVQAGRKP